MRPERIAEQSQLNAERPAVQRTEGSSSANGSADKRVGTDWIEYLENTGNIERYNGMCDCYVCRQIRDDYWPWKERKTAAMNPPNDGTLRRLPPPQSNGNKENENGGSRSLE